MKHGGGGNMLKHNKDIILQQNTEEGNNKIHDSVDSGSFRNDLNQEILGVS